MNRFIIITLIIILALLYCLFTLTPFICKEYMQSDFIEYHILTPKPLKSAPRVTENWYFISQTNEGSGQQISSLVFTGIKTQNLQKLREELDSYIDNYPDNHVIMSVSEEDDNGSVRLRLTCYDNFDGR
ncbi:hypothetical protein Cf24236_4529 [Citrobacter farmeri]|nr:hypothetical protein Cf24236_4529 [Citrobacter farmeri]HAU5704093.1 hypothetical protein [Citrobacter freundii]